MLVQFFTFNDQTATPGSDVTEDTTAPAGTSRESNSSAPLLNETSTAATDATTQEPYIKMCTIHPLQLKIDYTVRCLDRFKQLLFRACVWLFRAQNVP